MTPTDWKKDKLYIKMENTTDTVEKCINQVRNLDPSSFSRPLGMIYDKYRGGDCYATFKIADIEKAEYKDDYDREYTCTFKGM